MLGRQRAIFAGVGRQFMQRQRERHRHLRLEDNGGTVKVEPVADAMWRKRPFDHLVQVGFHPRLGGQDVGSLRQRGQPRVERLVRRTQVGCLPQRLRRDRLDDGHHVLQPVAEFVVQQFLLSPCLMLAAIVARDGGIAECGDLPLLSGPKLMIFWITKETRNAEQKASPGRDYRQAA
jgi:hypothetical protein